MAEKEIPLTGGNVNDGVVQIGNTVRRKMSRVSSTVHRLLHHLQEKGFSGSPQFLGIDDKNREILSFLEGETGIPNSIWQTDAPLIATAKLLREYHDATLDFMAPESAVWGYCYPDSKRHEVICHNDFAPYNFIYHHQLPYAVIDFDLIGPGPRLRDVAYAAYWMAPLSFHSEDQKEFTIADMQNGSRRLHLFCETYGIKMEPSLFDMVTEVLTAMGDEQRMQDILGIESAARLKDEGHLDHWQKEALFFQKYRSQLELNIKEKITVY